MATRILIIEDDPALNQMLALHFEDQGFVVFAAEHCEAGHALARREPLDVILLDQQLPDGEGISLLPRLLEVRPGAGIIMMTGQHDLDLAILAIKAGAADFIHKPVKAATLQAAVDQVLAGQSPEPEHVPAARERPLGELIGRSDAMLEVSKQIALSAANAATVLITGESGTGKEIVARLIHQHGNRGGGFVAINCAAIVETLLESELFGHEKGAFTGADRSKPGKFELAADGTLFLDEIGELAPPLQAKLLRALQERTIERVGGTRSIAISARIIAATHRDLFARAREGAFREDLAYRLNVINIELPALRDRREDVPLLATALLAKAARQNDRPPPALAQSAMDALQRHDWPGNVRELENVLTQAMMLARDGQISETHLRFRLQDESTVPQEPDRPDDQAGLQTLDQVEASHIQRVLDHTGGHKGRSCDILGISRPALDRKIQKYGLTLPDRD
ncbi:MAG: sigma-54 dependent transcriptional regulator [Sedimenticolaceae bacterium]